MKPVPSLLIDRRNYLQVKDAVLSLIQGAKLVGLDCETQDSNRHDGLNRFMKVDDEGHKSKAKALVFDTRRTVMTGFSFWPEGAPFSCYVNLAHADVENRLTWDEARVFLDALPADAQWVVHNAPFELTMFKRCHGYDLGNVICTLQMAVSAYGPDQYDPQVFRAIGVGTFQKILNKILSVGSTYTGDRNKMTAEQSELFASIIGKESSAETSYNGFVDAISFGYGLKEAVKTWFDHTMVTFEEVLEGQAHMGQLTGDQVLSYGAEDAFWPVHLYHLFIGRMTPQELETFFLQELPMVHVYAAIWQGGMRIDSKAIAAQREVERREMATVLKRMKQAVCALLPFQSELNEGLKKRDGKWYHEASAERYRTAITAWAESTDSDDDFTEAVKIRGPLSIDWAAERGHAAPTGPNFSHYMPIRVLLYDLMGFKPLVVKGKTQSDGEARGKLKDKAVKEFGKDHAAVTIIDCLNAIASIEQRVKLYLVPYELLMDPETDRLYPVVSSMLATRRMAARFPNPMQLAKRGQSVFVRSYFLGDDDDHVVVSIDWSGIELVEIGEFSGDPEFIKAFGKLPHDDLHSGAAADVLSAVYPLLNEKLFKAMPRMSVEQINEFIGPGILFNLKGEAMDPGKAAKYWRTEIGKGANFNYWYSGALSTVGDKMGWDSGTMWEATQRYRDRFAVAEQWRVDLIAQGCRDGYVTLPDGHRRTRFEATSDWLTYWHEKWQLFDNQGVRAFIAEIAKATQSRARNQLINAYIQGTCATIAKRSIIRIMRKMREMGWTDREARFLMPIHDELVFSVRFDLVVPFITMARGIMCDHPDLFKHCILDASPSVGLTFVPWSDKHPYGQVELYEAPKIPGVIKPELVGQRIANDDVLAVVDYLRHGRKAA